MNPRHPDLIRALLDPAVYPHPVGEIRLIETHISWILLTGQQVYKIKKPVDFGFLDFSDLDRRRHFCEEELRLNRRLAPQIYLDVVAITGSATAPVIAGAGTAIEYAVRMKQFNPAHQLDHLIADGRPPDRALLERLAAHVVAFHAAAGVATTGDDYGTPAAILKPALENFEQIAALPFTGPEAEPDAARLTTLRQWSEQTHTRLTGVMARRKHEGRVRECHGDLHLANLALIDGEVVPFDCLEFNPGLRWIDCVSEIAFLVMDLDYHGQPALGHWFLNAWLHHGGDHDGLTCLRFYLVYRAMVRAKVAGLRAQQTDSKDVQRTLLAQFRRHLALAHDYTRSAPQALIITHGLSGCGKTTLTDDLLFPCHALRVRSDVERKRLHGLAPDAHSGSGLDADLYDAAAGQRTYDRLAEIAETIINAGYTAIIDAAFLERDQRARFRALAGRLAVPFLILDIRADEQVLRERVQRRAENGRDASEAGLEVLDRQLRMHEPPGPDEQSETIVHHSDAPVDIDGLAAVIRTRSGERGR